MDTAESVRGLTIKQPWAFAIAEGFKTVENRINIVKYSRDSAIRLDELGGRSNYWDVREHIPSRIVAPPPVSLALSAVIATARLAGCHEAVDGCCAPWGFSGMWHWELADVRPLQRALPRAGALGLWKPDADLLAAVTAA